MDTHEQINEMLVDYVLGELSDPQSSEVEAHLTECQDCTSQAQRLRAVLKSASQMSELSADEQTCESARKAIFETIVTEEMKEPTPRPLTGLIVLWRIIMKSRMTKLAAAAAIIVVALIGIHQFIGPDVAWAEVLKNIRNSRTLTFLLRTSEEGPPIAKVMLIDPYLWRTEYLSKGTEVARLIGGQILIVDTEKGKALVLDTVKKKAKVCPADKAMLPIYDAYRNFRDMEDFSVEQVGRRRIGDIQAVGFKLKKQDGQREIMVWADPETRLPALMEETVEDAQGQTGRFFVTDIVFDADLDPLLFSVEPPEGYEIEEPDYVPMVNRLKSAMNVDRILKACRKYAGEHNGQWPDSLKELAKYGVDEETFVNPRQPERKVGYVYLKPPPSASEDTIVLYEAYDEWNEGINVGYASTRVQFVRDKSALEKQLKESSPPK